MSGKMITELIPLAANLIWTVSVFDLSEEVSAHYHKIQTQLILVLSGSMVIQLKECSRELHDGDFLSIPPMTSHAIMPIKKVCFLTVDFPGFGFPDDVYHENISTEETLAVPFVFHQGDSQGAVIDNYIRLDDTLIKELVYPVYMPEQYYNLKVAQPGYDAFSLSADGEQWSVAILDVFEAPAHYHMIGTEHFIVLNGALKITLEGNTYYLNPGQSVQVPPNVTHHLKSALETPVRVLCINFPSFDQKDFYMMKIDMNLPKIDDNCDVLPVNGKHGLCRSYYQPDEFDLKTIEYAQLLTQKSSTDLYALDLGCSPYFPQNQRLAQLGFYVDAFDLEKPMLDFDKINARHQNRISYHVKNIADIKKSDVKNNYDIVYSNRCLSFLSYPKARQLIQLLVYSSMSNTRYFLSFFSDKAKYAEHYPMHLPLEDRYVPLNSDIARNNQMLAPVCVYTEVELLDKLLGDLPITIIELLHAESGSLKIIFEKH